MQAIYKSLLYIFCILLSISCETVVDIDFQATDPMNVVDARITEHSPCVVILSKSQGFKDNTAYQSISGAVIELTDDEGNTDILEESHTEQGVYFSRIVGIVGKTYSLKVQVEDNIYEASATIPEAVPINNIYIYAIKAGSKSWYSPSFTFYDPPGVDNYYYTILTVNDKIMSTIYLNDDEYQDGMEVHRILYFDKDDNNDKDLETGDHIQIEMQTLDKGMYTYYKSLFTVADGSNPITNFSGGALGCFKAYNSTYGSAIVSQDIVYSDK